LHDRPSAHAPKLIARSLSLTCVHHKNTLQHATPLYCNKDVPLYRMKDTSVASRNTLMASIPEHCKNIFKEIKEPSCESTPNQAAGSS